MGHKMKMRKNPVKEDIIKRNKQTLLTTIQSAIDRALEESAEQDREQADLLDRYRFAVRAKSIRFAGTREDGTDFFVTTVAVSMAFPTAEAEGTEDKKLMIRQGNGSVVDWADLPEEEALGFLKEKIYGDDLFPRYVQIITLVISENIIQRSNFKGVYWLHITNHIGEAVGAVADILFSPASQEEYNKAAGTAFAAYCRENLYGDIPAGARRLTLEESSCSLMPGGGSERYWLRIELMFSSQDGERIPAQTSESLFLPSLFSVYDGFSVQGFRETIERKVTEFVWGKCGELGVAYSCSDCPDLPDSLRKCLDMAESGKNGDVVGYSPSMGLGTKTKMPEPPVCVVWEKEPVFACGKPPRLRKGKKVNWKKAVEADEHPYDIDSGVAPRNIYEFAQLVSQAGALYGSVDMIPGITKKPLVTFMYSRDFAEYISGFEGRTIREKLLHIFSSEMAREYAKEHAWETYTEELDRARLSAAELGILRYIYDNGSLSCTGVSRVQTDPLLTRDASGECLERLAHVMVTLPSGETVPVLQETEKYLVEYRTYYTAYCPQEDFAEASEQVFQRVTPREYTFSDIDSFIPSVRDEWRAKLMAAADAGGSESRWEALTCFEAFPKTFQAKYIKTAEGQEFFAAFEGDDAIYAELVLSGIPGGKTLAKKLYAKKDTD